MFLFLGNKRSVKKRDVLGIFDADTATVSEITKKFLSSADRKKMVESAGDELPKSFVLYTENGLYKICFSQFSPSALVGRMKTNYEI
ncbi:MAG: DUF370 domain-containing protein [Clostridia bacterium]|nr:DUF370 domain-containing protein [Clostridia bacterium]MBR2908563.1 DUF370 domain-containing protein [Clostridia bacterium]